MTTIPITQVGAGDAPIACTLNPGEYKGRLAALTQLAQRSLLSRAQIDGGERLRFRAGEDVERDLRAVVEAEAACCSFLMLELARRDDALVLDVTGPEAARPVIAELFA